MSGTSKRKDKVTYEKSTKCTSKGCGRKKQRDAIVLFVSLVPHTQIEHDPREEPTLRNAQKEPNGEESGKILGEAHQCANDAPYEGESGEPEPRRRPSENDIRRDLEQDITNKPDTQCCEILVSGLFRNGSEGDVHHRHKHQEKTYSCVYLRLNPQYGHSQLRVDEHTIRQREGGRYRCFGPERRERKEISTRGGDASRFSSRVSSRQLYPDPLLMRGLG